MTDTPPEPDLALESAGLARCAVLVPAWQPESGTVPLIQSLVEQGFGAVIVVNDGSDATHAAAFAEIAQLPRVTLLCHTVNRGKGRALKTGIRHVLNAMPQIELLVTADADGQHRVADIVRVAVCALQSHGAVVLGTRRFGNEVPLRSRFGNQLTRLVFGLVASVWLRDTQTGLRAFPRVRLAELLPLSGERYEYEMTVLAHLCSYGAPVELPIETVYLDGNRSSRFMPVRDSARIYLVLARFSLHRLRG